MKTPEKMHSQEEVKIRTYKKLKGSKDSLATL
jgi:hypothetical protein